MAIVFLNNFSTVTVNPLAPADTTLEIQDGIADIATALTGGNTLVLTLFNTDDQGNETQREITHVTAADEVAGTLTIERGGEGTTAGTWVPGAGVEQRLTAGALTEALSTPGYAVSGAAAVGEGAEATSVGAFAAMGGAYAENALAIGAGSSSGGIGASAVGDGATAYGDGGSSFGKGSTAGGTDALAAGGGDASYDRAVALGKTASAAGADALAVGSGASASGMNSVSIGPNASAIAECMAIGADSSANAPDTTSLGKQASASYPESMALGLMSSSAGTYSVALGARSKAAIDGGFSVSAVSYLAAAPDLSGGFGPPANITRQSAMQTVSATAEIDLTDASATVELSLPSGVMLMVDAFDVIVTSAGGTGGTPEIQVGPESANKDSYLAATPVSKTSVGGRETHAPLVSDGIGSIYVSVSTAGTGTDHKAKVVVRGYLLEM